MLAGLLPRLELLSSQQILPVVPCMEVHLLHGVASSGLHVDDLSFDPVAATHRKAGKLIDDLAIFVDNHLIRKFLPDKLPVTEADITACVSDTVRRIRSFMGHASDQENCGH